MPTTFDRIDLALRKTEQMEGRGESSLLDVTVSDDGEIVGRGEDFFVLPLHVFKTPKEKTCSIVCFFAGLSLGRDHDHIYCGETGSYETVRLQADII
jgi:hypothetical protein